MTNPPIDVGVGRNEVARQVEELFRERGLVPVVNASGLGTVLHAALAGDRLQSLCHGKGRRKPVREARSSDLAMRPCRACTREHIRIQLCWLRRAMSGLELPQAQAADIPALARPVT